MKNTSHSAIVALALSALAGTANAELMYATTASGFFISFDSASPGTTLSGFPIQGLLQNEEVVGIDRRPSTGEIYALGSFGVMYTIDPATGTATSLGTITGATLNGSAFGFDFNPVLDRVRIQSDVDQNLRVNPGVLPNDAIIDGPLTYAAGDVNVGSDRDISFDAYSNNFAGATQTTLYAIDAHTDSLAFLASPADGLLSTVGLLGVDIGPRGGFDISSTTGIAYLAALPTDSSQSSLYIVNLDTGAITLIDQIAGGLELRSLTVVPAPGSVALFALAGLGLRRRRA